MSMFCQARERPYNCSFIQSVVLVSCQILQNMCTFCQKMLLKFDDQFLAQFLPYFIGTSQSHGLIYFVICIYFMFYT